MQSSKLLVRIVVSSLFGCLVAAETGCSENSSVEERPIEPEVRSAATEITFRYQHKVGDVERWQARSELRVEPASRPLVFRQKNKSEVVEVNEKGVKWKSTETCEIESAGDHAADPERMSGMTYRDRISFTQYDARGEYVSSEGEEDPEPSHNIPPQGVVRLNDKWNGYTTIKGKRYNDRYQLKAILSVNGSHVAVIEYSSDRSYNSIQTGTMWIDENSTLLKVESRYKGFNYQRNPSSGSTVMHVIDKDGNPVFP